MFLTSLTMKGFKSFADKTTLKVEPGITVIVGPNGSGKSNVVEALGWVMGTASAKKMRSSSMSDVIFAGSPTRAGLSRAQVEIVIDNSDGVLGSEAIGTSGSAQQFSEVRVSREILATGENIYAINGEEVRALDVQELLSDTGLGREMHTVVGQGQLDAILNAKPEDRRAFIEEAAGILKHRRRRERAIRKLEQVDAHIDKLKTVLRELRRQLKPLERQAEAANRHADLQAQLREVKARLAANRLHRLQRQASQGEEVGAEVADRLRGAEQALAGEREREQALEAQLAELEPRHERAQRIYYQLASLLERLRGTADLVEAKRRHLIEYVEEPLAGRPPDELRRQAERLDAEREQRLHARTRTRERLDEAIAGRREAETARRAHEQRLAAEARRHAEQRERVLRWEGEVSALRGALASAESEVGRVQAQLSSLDGRIAEAEADVTKVQEEIQQLDASEVELTEALEAAERRVEVAQEGLDAASAQERELERERASQAARAEALRAALDETAGGVASLLAGDIDGVLGRLADHVRIEPEWRTAVAAALGPAGEAVLTTSAETARRAVTWLRATEAGRAVVLAARGVADARLRPELDDDARDELRAAGAQPLPELVSSRGSEHSERAVTALRGALARTWAVPTWDAAVLLHGRHPLFTFVTIDGDVAGPFGYVGGAAPERSAVVTATAAEDAERRVGELEEQLVAARAEVRDAQAELATAREVLKEATSVINESDARITGAAERLARVNKELTALTNQREVVAAQRHELAEVLERDRTELGQLMQRGPDVEELADPVATPDSGEGERLEAAVEEAREAEMVVRVELERIDEQVRHLEVNAEDLRREAEQVEQALAEAARRRELRREGIVRCRELGAFCELAVEALQASIVDAERDRDALEDRIGEVRGQAAHVRERAGELAQQLEEVREERHAADLRRSELQGQIEVLDAKVRDELGMSPAELLEEHPDAAGYAVAELEEREDVLVRQLGMLGRVNPLALEEFKALEDRHAFLSGQLEDLRDSKRDLEQVIDAVDDKIREVFAAAYTDIEREFERIFGQMFPGGHGRLELTDPDDLLTTGIEVHARPPGKKVKSLSLLSGGERSLTVLAFVFAIFKARPSPFYVLDEVDAALDDVNLARLIGVIESFKEYAQLIVVTHQRRTMEIADVLYGVTMGSDAVTKVVAERLEDVGELVS